MVISVGDGSQQKVKRYRGAAYYMLRLHTVAFQGIVRILIGSLLASLHPLALHDGVNS